MAANQKIIYIYLEGDDSRSRARDALQKKYLERGIEFIPIMVKDGRFPPNFPDIDENTKIIINAHASPRTDHFSSLADGTGNTLTAETIVQQLAQKSKDGAVIRLALYGCDSGVGRDTKSHQDSLAGRIFNQLTRLGRKPIISANLSQIQITEQGRVIKGIALSNKDALLDRYARRHQVDIENIWYALQNSRRTIYSSKAQGSKVILRYKEAGMGYNQAENMQIEYPYGHPDDKFDETRLSHRGRAEIMVEQKFQREIQPFLSLVKKPLIRIFEDYEKMNPDIANEEGYKDVKQFLLTNDEYLPDIVSIAMFIDSELSGHGLRSEAGALKKMILAKGVFAEFEDKKPEFKSSIINLAQETFATSLNPLIDEMDDLGYKSKESTSSSLPPQPEMSDHTSADAVFSFLRNIFTEKFGDERAEILRINTINNERFIRTSSTAILTPEEKRVLISLMKYLEQKGLLSYEEVKLQVRVAENELVERDSIHISSLSPELKETLDGLSVNTLERFEQLELQQQDQKLAVAPKQPAFSMPPQPLSPSPESNDKIKELESYYYRRNREQKQYYGLEFLRRGVHKDDKLSAATAVIEWLKHGKQEEMLKVKTNEGTRDLTTNEIKALKDGELFRRVADIEGLWTEIHRCEQKLAANDKQSVSGESSNSSPRSRK